MAFRSAGLLRHLLQASGDRVRGTIDRVLAGIRVLDHSLDQIREVVPFVVAPLSFPADQVENVGEYAGRNRVAENREIVHVDRRVAVCAVGDVDEQIPRDGAFLLQPTGIRPNDA